MSPDRPAPGAGPTRRGTIATAIVVLLLALASVASAANAASPAQNPTAAAAAKQRCPLVTGETDGGWTSVRVARTKGVSCASARAVVERCIDHRTVKGWKAAADAEQLANGRRTIALRASGSDTPNCLHEGTTPRLGASVGLGVPPGPNTAGPWQSPLMMPPYSAKPYEWTTPVVSWMTLKIDVSSVTFVGRARTAGDQVRSVWFEYGKTRDLGQRTEAQNPKVVTIDVPSEFTQHVQDLKAKTRYFWRAVANVDKPGGGTELRYGAVGSFVTQPYRKVNSSNPCQGEDFGGNYGGVTEVTESLTIVCGPKETFRNNNITIIPTSVGYNGRLTCPREYARDLNAGDKTSYTIPKIDYTVSLNKEVNYWRSNGSARFTTFPGYQKNYEGHKVGPLQGWSNYDIDQWNDGFAKTSTDVQFWINCTDNWDAVSVDALAAGEGDDNPVKTAPSVPRDFTWTRRGDGYDATWKAPEATAGAAGIAGYQFNVFGVHDGSPAAVVLSATDTDGRLTDAYLRELERIYRTRTLYAQVAAISREGVRGPFAVVPFTFAG